MSVLTNTQWRIHANATAGPPGDPRYNGNLILNEDVNGKHTGTVFGDRLSDIDLYGNLLTFTRQTTDPNTVQIYVGIVTSRQWGVDTYTTMMGTFGVQTGGLTDGAVYMWSTDGLVIPG